MDIDEVIARLPLKEDKTFIREQLSRFPSNKRSEIFKEYLDNWRIGRDEEKVEYKKRNAGRYKANRWVRMQ